jgi:hypothetical protein
VRALLDNSLEITIAVARLVTVLAFLGTFGALAAWLWHGDVRFGGLAALAFALGWLVGWFGFWLFGNEEWKRGKTDDRAAAVRHD